MDAVNRYWQILRALVLTRTLVVVMLGLFYVLAAFLFVVLDPDKRASVIAVMSAIPAGGFFALATERIVSCSIAAGSLGIPAHAEHLRRAQVCMMGIFIVVPAIVAVCYGGQPGYMALLCVPAALGVLLALYGRWAFVVWIVLVVLSHFSYSLDSVFPRLSSPWLRVVLIVASIALLTWWLGLAKRTERRYRGLSLVMADSRHEVTAEAAGASLGVDPVKFAQYEQAVDRAMTRITTGITNSGITRRALQTGLAMPGPVHWRLVAIVVAISLAALLFLHPKGPNSGQPTAYLGFTLLATVLLLAQLNAVMNACKARANEEALLVLAPRWPTQDKVKTLFLQIILERQSGTWAAWILVSLFATVLGWVGVEELFTSIVIMIAASSCASGALLLAMSRKVFKEVSLLTIAMLLCGAVGTVVFLVGTDGMAEGQMLGLILILVPPAAGALSFTMRPLQFPVRIINKQ